MPCKRKTWKISDPEQMDRDMRTIFVELAPGIKACKEEGDWFQLSYALKTLIGWRGSLKSGKGQNADQFTRLDTLQKALLRIATNVGNNAESFAYDFSGISQRLSYAMPYCPSDLWATGVELRLVSPDGTHGITMRRKLHGDGKPSTCVLWRFTSFPGYETSDFLKPKVLRALPVFEPTTAVLKSGPATVTEDADTLAEMIQGIIDKRVKEAIKDRKGLLVAANKEISALKARLAGIKKAVSF